jgi:hypothetical protein
MAKHPHKLILQNKKTWRCTLQGCNFFVHLGLAHILVNKTGVCWECEDQFVIDEFALREEMPRCIDCRINHPLIVAIQQAEPTVEPEPIASPEVEEAKRKLYRDMGWKLD